MRVICAHCDKEFEIKQNRYSNSKSGLFFCCKECRVAEQRIGGKLQLKHYKKRKKCLNCKKNVNRAEAKYCSLKCQSEHRKNKRRLSKR